MKNELLVKKCDKCGTVVQVLAKCECEECGDEVKVLAPNTTEASFEKHIPTYEHVEDEIFVKVNHVMEKEHYIEWLAMVNDNIQTIVRLYPEQNAEARFKYIPGSKIYAYCNKHDLWMAEVE